MSLTAGTVLHNTKTPLTIWFWASYMMVTYKRGASASWLQRQLGLRRYETAWLLRHMLRRAMVNAAGLARGLLSRPRKDDGIMDFRSGIGGFLVEFEPMSPEERERMLHFLLNQQAQFAADLAKSQARFDAGMEKLSAKTDRIADGLIGLTSIVGQIAAEQQVTGQQLRETKTRLDEVGDYIRTVESNLNAVIEMFERHLREDHGQRPPS